jgi:hypothetical protein
MPARSKVNKLTPAIKAWLDAELVRRGFADYEELAADLKAKGADVSKSSLHRYGSAFEERLAKLKMASEQARAVVAASPDDGDAMSEALLRLTQQKTFDLLIDAEIDPSKVDFNKLTLNVSRMVRASLPLKKWRSEVKTKMQGSMKLLELEARAMNGDKSEGALEMLKRVREDAYALFDN